MVCVCVCVKCDVCGYVLVNSHVICLQVHESQSNDGPGSYDVSVHLIPLLHQTGDNTQSEGSPGKIAHSSLELSTSCVG